MFHGRISLNLGAPADASEYCEWGSVEYVKLADTNKIRASISPSRNLVLSSFGELPILLNKGKFAIPRLSLMVLRCCPLYLVRQSYFLYIFQRTLILMTQVAQITDHLVPLPELILDWIIFL